MTSTLSPQAEAVLQLSQEALHTSYPFTKSLTFNPNKLWVDADHSKMSKACTQSGSNIYSSSNSIIVGTHNVKGAANYWVIGDGADIIPYNRKAKLNLIKKIVINRPRLRRRRYWGSARFTASASYKVWALISQNEEGGEVSLELDYVLRASYLLLFRLHLHWFEFII